jgi:hypothetical protein
MALGDDLSEAITDTEAAALWEQMNTGATMFAAKAGGKYEDGATLMIITKFPDGIGVAVHFVTREGMVKIRDQFNMLFPHA